MPLPLLDAIVRLFRRPAKSNQPIVHTVIGLPADPPPSLGMPPDPDLALLLANGRAAAERLHQQLADPAAPPTKPQPTKFTYRCGWCLEPFEREPRSLGELEKLRQVLFITGPDAMVPIDICDTCYDSVVGSAMPVNGHTGLLDIGGDNHGPSNMLLRCLHKPAA